MREFVTAQPINADLAHLRCLADYALSEHARNLPIIERELVDLATHIEPDSQVAQEVVRSCLPAAVAAYFERADNQGPLEMSKPQGYVDIPPVDVISFEPRLSERSLETARLIAPRCTQHPAELGMKILMRASSAKNFDLIDPMFEVFGVTAAHQDYLYLKHGIDTRPYPICPPWFASYQHSDFHLEPEHWADLLDDSSPEVAIRSVALALYNQVDIRDAIKSFHHPTDGQWKARLQRTTESAHGLMDAFARMPKDRETILTMRLDHLINRISGPSKRQEKKKRNIELRRQRYQERMAAANAKPS